MRLFRCNENATTYKIPILKIILSVLVIILSISRNSFLTITNLFWEVVFRVICCVIVILSALCIYISFAEILLVYEHKAGAKTNIETAQKKSIKLSVDHVMSLIEANDIIEIAVFSNNQIVKLGVASDCRPGSSQFFDRSYYINNHNVTIEELKEELNHCSIDGEICVIAIDEMLPDYFKKR